MNESTNPRFQVRRPGGPYMRIVWDSWLGTEAAKFYGHGPNSDTDSPETISNRAQLLAETRASELNLQSADPVAFISRLATHLVEARESEIGAGEILEDVDKILEHYLGRLRGVKTTDLEEGQIYSWLPWLGNV